MLVDWDNRLIKHLKLYTDIHGNNLWPLFTKAQFLEYSRLCYEHKQVSSFTEVDQKPVPMTEEETKDLSEFWDFFKEKSKKDGTVMVIVYNKKEEIYQPIVYYMDKILDVNEVKGDKIGE